VVEILANVFVLNKVKLVLALPKPDLQRPALTTRHVLAVPPAAVEILANVVKKRLRLDVNAFHYSLRSPDKLVSLTQMNCLGHIRREAEIGTTEGKEKKKVAECQKNMREGSMRT